MTAPTNQLVPIGATTTLPALVAAAGERASMRFLEFFAANLRNPHARRAYYRAAEEFLTWRVSAGVPSIAAVQPVHSAGLDQTAKVYPFSSVPSHRGDGLPHASDRSLIC
jgi:hypothetical protein